MNILEKYDIVPNDEKLYEIAFTHSSYSAKHDLDYDYEHACIRIPAEHASKLQRRKTD